MAAPNWNRTAPSRDVQRFWTDTGTASNPTAGYWTDRTIEYSPQTSDLGNRTHTVTPGYFSKGRNWLYPLGYDAFYVIQSASGISREADTNIRYASGGTPVWYYQSDSTTWSENDYQFAFAANPTWDTSLANELRSKASQKVLDKLKDSSINVAVAFAEREQTLRTVTSTAKAIADTLRNLRNGNFVGAARALGVTPAKRARRRFNKAYEGAVSPDGLANAVTKGWLGLQYGWKPLLQDTYGAAEHLAKVNLRGENPNTIIASASGKGSRLFKSTTRSNFVIAPGFVGEDYLIQNLDASLSITTKVYYSMSSPTVHDLSSLGITNPALVAWELVPYSFVVDWFLPIGNWLSALDATNGLTFLSGYSTSYQTYRPTTQAIQNLTYPGRPGTVRFRWFTASQRQSWTTRTVLSGFPAAPMPRFKNPLSFSHMMSAMSLLKQFKR